MKVIEVLACVCDRCGAAIAERKSRSARAEPLTTGVLFQQAHRDHPCEGDVTFNHYLKEYKQ